MTVHPNLAAHRDLARLRAGACVPRLASARSVLAAWGWPVGMSLVILALVELPFRLAAGQSAVGLAFSGMLWSLNDASQYASAMRQGAESPSWLIYDQFSQEPHAPALLYPFYVGLGKLAALLGVGIDEAFLAASLAGRCALLLATYAVTRLLSTDRSTRLTAFILVILSSGLGSLLLVVQLLTGLNLPIASLEREHPELNTFLVLFTAPHLMFGLALALVAARLYADCWSAPPGRRQVWLAGVVVLLGLTNPFALGSLMAMVAAHGLLMMAHGRRLDRSGHGAWLLVGVVGLPLVAVNALTFLADPFWSATYGGQNVQLAPPPVDLVMSLGLLVPLALVGLPGLVRPAIPSRLVILAWIVAAIVVMHLPIGTQRRFALGLHPMLALAATGATIALLRWFKAFRGPALRMVRVPVLAGLAQVLFGTSAYTYAVAAMVALAPSLGYQIADLAQADRSPYQPGSVQALATWLSEHEAPDDVVLGSTATGNHLAGAVPGRVYVGHWVATLEYDSKVERMHWFYAGPLDEERRAFLASSGIRYVVYGPYERRLNPALTRPAHSQPVFSAPDVDVIDVRSLPPVSEAGTHP